MREKHLQGAIGRCVFLGAELVQSHIDSRLFGRTRARSTEILMSSLNY